MLLTIFVSFLSTISPVFSDTTEKYSECKIEFINHYSANYLNKEGYWIPCIIDSNGKKINTIVKSTHEKKWYHSMVNDLYNSSPQKKWETFSAIFLTLIPKSTEYPKHPKLYDTVKLLPNFKDFVFVNNDIIDDIDKLGIKKILRVYFDKNKQLKSQYISYKNEIIWYAYKKNVVVYANDSNKCYYIEPIPCNEEKLLSIKREQERKWNVYQSRITVSDAYKGPKYAFVKIFADSLSYMTDTSKIDPNANNITAYFLKGKRKIKLHYIEDNVLLLTNVHKYNYLVFEHQNKQIKIPTDMLLSGFLEFDLWFNKNPLAQETDIRQNPLPQLAKYRIKDDATPHHLAFVWRSNGNFTKQGTISTGIEKLDKYFLLEK